MDVARAPVVADGGMVAVAADVEQHLEIITESREFGADNRANFRLSFLAQNWYLCILSRSICAGCAILFSGVLGYVYDVHQNVRDLRRDHSYQIVQAICNQACGVLSCGVLSCQKKRRHVF